jgi:hypothetical protein
MDLSDRIESRDRLAIPDHLVFAFEEWIAELIIREACDGDSPETRDAVIKAVHFHDALATESLTPAQLAELAEGAAGWMSPSGPMTPLTPTRSSGCSASPASCAIARSPWRQTTTTTRAS